MPDEHRENEASPVNRFRVKLYRHAYRQKRKTRNKWSRNRSGLVNYSHYSHVSDSTGISWIEGEIAGNLDPAVDHFSQR